MRMPLLLLALLLPFESVPLDNPYARVTRNAAPCATARSPACGDRVLVALGPLTLRTPSGPRTLTRGDVVVFERGRPYEAPADGEFVEVNLKPDRPPVQSPADLSPPEKNTLLYDGADFFVFEEKLDPGDTRARHGHSQRVVIVINATRLQQWPDDEPEVFKTQEPDRVGFNPPVVHVVKTIGERPMRNIVIEFKPERPKPSR
jgi:hypothetical protein